jgi:hypothetical protein
MTLPQGLDQLFRDDTPTDGPVVQIPDVDGGPPSRRLDVALPPGRLVAPVNGGPPAYWLSDGPAPDGLWEALLDAHEGSGLWPLLLGGLHGELERPWQSGEVHLTRHTSPADHDANDVLSRWWTDMNTPDDDDSDGAYPPELAGGPDGSDPFGHPWPGLAPAGVLETTPDHRAGEIAGALVDGVLRLGLVAADRGADALTVAGWNGPMNHTNDTAEISAVVRDWEERFGVRVVSVGFDTLVLSVAAPPVDMSQARAIADEHLAFCPDNIWQGPGSLPEYAESLLGSPLWAFWWD